MLMIELLNKHMFGIIKYRYDMYMYCTYMWCVNGKYVIKISNHMEQKKDLEASTYFFLSLEFVCCRATPVYITTKP